MVDKVVFAFLVLQFGKPILGHIPEVDLPTPGLIRHWGYPVEEHEVETKDGYILTLHRIPRGRNQSDAEDKSRQVIYLQHTFLSSSADWVMNNLNSSLGFVLADSGFDVWLGNLRGNIYSKRHKTLNPKSKAFWDFSLDEHAKYDFPAMVDYILKNTSQSQLYYVGHSYGCMIAMAAISDDKAILQKIKVFFALAPITRMAHMSLVTRVLVNMASKISWLLSWMGVHEFFPPLKVGKWFITTICRWVPSFCKFGISILGGKEHKFLNKTRIPVYVAHTPSGTSVKSFYQAVQWVQTKRFLKYDYGSVGNKKHYKVEKPPEYDITKMKVPTVIMSGSEDNMAPPADMVYTKKTLPFVIKHFEVKGYSHMDFIWGIESGTKIYTDLSYYM